MPVTLPKRPVQNSRHESVPRPEDPVQMSPQCCRRLKGLFAAADVADNHPDFNGLVLLSLACYVDDKTWNQALNDAVETLKEQE